MLTEYTAAELLLSVNAVTFRPSHPLRFESGLLSPIFVHCRVLASHPRERALVAESLTEAFRNSAAQADVVVGAGGSAIALAESVARRLDLPLAYVRKEQKAHGLRKQIEGAAVENRTVLLIADVISTGADVPASVEAVQTAGGTISSCLAVFDMELKEHDRFLVDNKIPYQSLTTLSKLLIVAETKNQLSSSERILVEAWRHSPTDWDGRRRQQLDDASRRCKLAVAEALVRTKAVQIRTDPPFQYASGAFGPIYTDNRVLLGYPTERNVILDGMADAVVHEVGLRNIDCIAAVATAGIPYASGLSERLNLPMVIVKSSADDHGLGRRIDGDLRSGERVLLVEDLVNQGTSIFSAANTLRAAGAVVVGCMAVFTYGLPSTRDKFAENNLTLVSLSDLESLLMIGVERGVITVEQQQIVREWVAHPEAWMKTT